MSDIKEIILFSEGDSTKASTWSNIPYLMAKTFCKKNIIVHRVNLSPNKYIKGVINKFLRVLNYGKDYSCTRSPLFRYIINQRIKKVVKRYSKSDFCVFLLFDYYNKYNAIPSLLFSDWTYKILIERHGYILTKQEQRFLNDQYEAINNADLVIPMFQESLDKMKVDYSDANIHGINQNVINNLDDEEIEIDQLLEKKISSNYIVFIGRNAYKEGLERLIKAVESLNLGIDIHVIGMTKVQIKDCPAFVKFHGYLRKDDPNENKKYYQLIREARLIANPTPQWSAYSSIVEGMYYYNPVIVYPFNQFVKEFGSKIDFGYYTTTASDLSNNIRRIFEMPEKEYCKISKQVHEKVKNYTWDKYVDRIINLMSDTINKNSKK